MPPRHATRFPGKVKFKMKIVIVGDGKVGYTLTEQLSKEGHDIVVIDSSDKALQNSINILDVMGIKGNGASYPVQMEAGVPDADLLIAATSTDEQNILCCMLAKKLGARHTIARVRNPEYAEQLVLLKNELGLSLSINPELTAAVEISRILRFPSAVNIETFGRGRAELVEIKIDENSPLNGQSLATLRDRFRIKVLVCAVQRNKEVYIPSGDFRLQAGDRIHVTASPSEISAFCRAVGLYQHKVRSVMIIGGGRISFYLAKQLIDMGMQVKIIEINEERCRHLCEKLPKAEIIFGDGTEHEVLKEEGIAGTDAFVSLTDNDEENIITSMYAASKSVHKVITKVNRLSLTSILENTGVETVISPKDLTANQIIRYVRAMQNSFGSNNIETLYRIVNGKVEVLEFLVREHAPFLGRPLKELQLKKNLLLAVIVRRGKTIIPDGNNTIMMGDSVIVVTVQNNLRDLSDIFR